MVHWSNYIYRLFHWLAVWILMVPNASLLGSFSLYGEMAQLMTENVHFDACYCSVVQVHQVGGETVTPPVRLQYLDDHVQSPMMTMQDSGGQMSAALLVGDSARQ
ncbi:hypothetical protein EDC04DRAFT_222487 [Pisolithus marmoratus]|nr:hypothetical protein EDC04DRAFT_222487 [Pisolithus marmoratus]